MHLVVTGSRYGHPQVANTLDIARGYNLQILVLGCAEGVDRQALEWACDNNVFFVAFSAEWDRLNGAAGPERNKKMIALGKELGAVVLAFPGYKSFGTWDCVRKGRAAGLKVAEIPAGAVIK